MADYNVNGTGIRTFSKQFRGILEPIFAYESVFTEIFAGGLETVDGITDKTNAFSVKTSNLPVTINEYSTADIATTNRFGTRKEVIYSDVEVPYTDNWAFHEGIDRMTVNNNFDAAVADRLEQQSISIVENFNDKHSKWISTVAGKTFSVAAIDKDTVIKAFTDLAKHFVNSKVKSAKIAYVTPDVYNAIIESGLATTSKQSGVNVDDNTITKFKGFEIKEIAESYFQTKECIYACAKDCAKAFVGVQTTRTIESEDFDGQAFQGCGRSGQYIPDANKVAVAKVKVGG